MIRVYPISGAKNPSQNRLQQVASAQPVRFGTTAQPTANVYLIYDGNLSREMWQFLQPLRDALAPQGIILVGRAENTQMVEQSFPNLPKNTVFLIQDMGFPGETKLAVDLLREFQIPPSRAVILSTFTDNPYHADGTIRPRFNVKHIVYDDLNRFEEGYPVKSSTRLADLRQAILEAAGAFSGEKA